jgi:hypothetical protein
MLGPIDSLFQAIRRLRSAPVATGSPANAEHPAVIVHDPAAQAPHDLDDPFFDSRVQSRMADVIANAGQKK